MGSGMIAFMLYRRIDYDYDEGGPDDFLGLFSSMPRAVDAIVVASGDEYRAAIAEAKRELARKRPSYAEARRWAIKVADLDHRAWIEHMLATNKDGFTYYVETAEMDAPRPRPVG